MEGRGSRLSRRQFLVGASATGLLAGCGRLPLHTRQPPRAYRVAQLRSDSILVLPGGSSQAVAGAAGRRIA